MLCCALILSVESARAQAVPLGNPTQYLSDLTGGEPVEYTSIDTEQHRLTMDTQGLGATDAAYLGEHLSHSATLLFRYKLEPLVLRSEGFKIARVIQHQMGFELGAHISLYEWAAVSFSMPGVLIQNTNLNTQHPAANLLGIAPEGIVRTALGDLRLNVKLRGLDERRFGVALTPYLGLNLPTSQALVINQGVEVPPDASTFVSTNQPAYRLGVFASKRMGLMGAHANLIYHHQQAGVYRDFAPVLPLIQYRFGASTDMKPLIDGQVNNLFERAVLSAEVFGETATRFPFGLSIGGGDEVEQWRQLWNRMEFLVSVRMIRKDGFQPFFGVGGGILAGLGVPRARVHVGFTYGQPADVPDLTNDDDLDGIENDIDKCPLKPEDRDGFEDEDGCPERDNDGDDIPDLEDYCINQAGTALHHGCPIHDKDGDGISDEADRCPDQVGPRMFGGCPDTDSDGIPDPDDKCPTEKETINGIDDYDGCPDKGKGRVVVKSDRLEVLEQIYFDYDQIFIKSRSFPLLDEIALTLKAYPYLYIRILGHTDFEGREEYNQELSDKRANEVRYYLIEKGIDANRLEAKGYGELVPAYANDDEKGRQLNRRVEFVIIDSRHLDDAKDATDSKEDAQKDATPAKDPAPNPKKDPEKD